MSVGAYRCSRDARRADRRAPGAHAVPARACPRASSTAPAARSCWRRPSRRSSARSATSSRACSGPAGFDPARDIAAITVNRWPHGYAYQYNSLWDPVWLDGRRAALRTVARRRFGRIAIANADAGRLLLHGRRHRPGATAPCARCWPEPRAPAFARVLGRADLLLFSVCAILTIDTLASAASMGVSWFTWWGITMVAVLRALRPHHRRAGRGLAGGGRPVRLGARGAGRRAGGALAAWFYWINNAYWMPVGLHGVRGDLPHHLPARPPAGRPAARARARPGCRRASRSSLTWLTVASAWCGCEVSKWVPEPGRGGEGRDLPRPGRARPRSPRCAAGRPPTTSRSARLRARAGATSLAFLPVLLYNALGFELMSSAGEEMRDPQRDVPRVILLSGPRDRGRLHAGRRWASCSPCRWRELSLLTGTWDALVVLGRQWGAAGDALVLLLGSASSTPASPTS